jgi:Zn-dependent peptidase ImmA (M78 family)
MPTKHPRHIEESIIKAFKEGMNSIPKIKKGTLKAVTMMSDDSSRPYIYADEKLKSIPYQNKYVIRHEIGHIRLRSRQFKKEYPKGQEEALASRFAMRRSIKKYKKIDSLMYRRMTRNIRKLIKTKYGI